MSGAATFSGTTYQARVVAHIYVHILAQARLGWLAPADDTPIAVSGETGGPGDDAQIEFGEQHAIVEVQAKHGLTGGAKLTEAVFAVRDNSKTGDTMEVIFTVDRSSSRTVYRDFARDLERLRSGRTDRLKAEASRLLTQLGADASVLHRLFLVPLDMDAEQDPEAKFTFQLLESVLEDPQDRSSAWAVLLTDAGDVSAKRLRRTRKELVERLAGAGIKVRPPTKDERFMRQLDFSKRLLESGHARAVLKVLSTLEPDIRAENAAPHVHYRLLQHRAAALLALALPAESLAAAKKALDIEPFGPHALVIAALAAAQTGALDLANQYAERAITNAPENADAWAAKAQIAAAAGKLHTPPRASVEESDPYQLALAQIATRAGDWPLVLTITAGLLKRTVRPPSVLYLRATALLALPEEPGKAITLERRMDAERLATEAIEGLDEDHPLMTELLVQRAEARSKLGRTGESNADLEFACQLDRDDPIAIGRLADAHASEGRFVEALQLLTSRVVDAHPALLLSRARALAASGDERAARRDLETALSRAEDAPKPDDIRLNAAVVAMMLSDYVLAESTLNTIKSDVRANERHAILWGRLAFSRRDPDVGIVWFRKAVELAPDRRQVLLVELGDQLLRHDRPREAVGVFDEIGLSKLPESALGVYTRALMGANELTRAAKVIEDLAVGQVPEWALAISVDIAIRRGDTRDAVGALERLAERHPGDRRVRSELARRLLEIGEPDAAKPHLDELAQDNTLTPGERIETAYLLKQAGRNDEAVALAFRAFRSAPHDPSIHRGFATLMMVNPPAIPLPMEVGPDTYVRLVGDDGSERAYVIYAQGSIDPLRNELSAADAASVGYLGKRVDEVVTVNAGTWQETRWTVAEVLPAVVYAFRDVVGHYQERFPGEPFFVTSFKVSDETSVRFLAPLISSLQARRAGAEEAFRLYHESTLPLGFVSRVLGASIADVMSAATAKDPDLGPLFVDWPDAEGQDESRDAARHATQVVITRSALETLADLDMLDRVAGAYVWVGPQSLLNLLNHELAVAEESQDVGLRFVTSGPTGVLPVELSPGDPHLVDRTKRAARILEWFTSNARIDMRPLETIPAVGSREEETGNSIGQDSYDAVCLAEHLGGTMFADDLGLRRFLPKGSRARSFSTTAVLPILAERGLISADERDQMLLQLLEKKHAVIAPTPSLLNVAIRKSEGVMSSVSRAFSLLGGPAQDLSAAARVVAEVLKMQVLASVQTIDVEKLVNTALAAMAPRWGAVASANAVSMEVARLLKLFPQQVERVRSVATAFVKAHR